MRKSPPWNNNVFYSSKYALCFVLLCLTINKQSSIYLSLRYFSERLEGDVSNSFLILSEKMALGHSEPQYELLNGKK
jgi:hypothetical protein